MISYFSGLNASVPSLKTSRSEQRQTQTLTHPPLASTLTFGNSSKLDDEHLRRSRETRGDFLVANRDGYVDDEKVRNGARIPVALEWSGDKLHGLMFPEFGPYHARNVASSANNTVKKWRHKEKKSAKEARLRLEKESQVDALVDRITKVKIPQKQRNLEAQAEMGLPQAEAYSVLAKVARENELSIAQAQQILRAHLLQSPRLAYVVQNALSPESQDTWYKTAGAQIYDKTGLAFVSRPKLHNVLTEILKVEQLADGANRVETYAYEDTLNELATDLQKAGAYTIRVPQATAEGLRSFTPFQVQPYTDAEIRKFARKGLSPYLKSNSPDYRFVYVHTSADKTVSRQQAATMIDSKAKRECDALAELAMTVYPEYFTSARASRQDRNRAKSELQQKLYATPAAQRSEIQNLLQQVQNILKHKKLTTLPAIGSDGLGTRLPNLRDQLNQNLAPIVNTPGTDTIQLSGQLKIHSDPKTKDPQAERLIQVLLEGQDVPRVPVGTNVVIKTRDEKTFWDNVYKPIRDAVRISTKVPMKNPKTGKIELKNVQEGSLWPLIEGIMVDGEEGIGRNCKAKVDGKDVPIFDLLAKSNVYQFESSYKPLEKLLNDRLNSNDPKMRLLKARLATTQLASMFYGEQADIAEAAMSFLKGTMIGVGGEQGIEHMIHSEPHSVKELFSDGGTYLRLMFLVFFNAIEDWYGEQGALQADLRGFGLTPKDKDVFGKTLPPFTSFKERAKLIKTGDAEGPSGKPVATTYQAAAGGTFFNTILSPFVSAVYTNKDSSTFLRAPAASLAAAGNSASIPLMVALTLPRVIAANKKLFNEHFYEYPKTCKTDAQKEQYILEISLQELLARLALNASVRAFTIGPVISFLAWLPELAVKAYAPTHFGLARKIMQSAIFGATAPMENIGRGVLMADSKFRTFPKITKRNEGRAMDYSDDPAPSPRRDIQPKLNVRNDYEGLTVIPPEAPTKATQAKVKAQQTRDTRRKELRREFNGRWSSYVGKAMEWTTRPIQNHFTDKKWEIPLQEDDGFNPNAHDMV